MPEPENPDHRSTPEGNSNLEPKPKSGPEGCGLAVYHKRCEEETQATPPEDLRELGDKEH